MVGLLFSTKKDCKEKTLERCKIQGETKNVYTYLTGVKQFTTLLFSSSNKKETARRFIVTVVQSPRAMVRGCFITCPRHDAELRAGMTMLSVLHPGSLAIFFKYTQAELTAGRKFESATPCQETVG